MTGLAATLWGFLSNPRKSLVLRGLWALLALYSRSVGLSRLKVLEVKSGVAEDAKKKIELYPEGPSICVDVNPAGPQTHVAGRAPLRAVQAYELESASVIESHSFQAAVVGSFLCVAERNQPGPWKIRASTGPKRDGNVIAQRHPLVVLRHSKKTTIGREPQAIFVGSRAPLVWAHWLANFLPSVFAARALGDEYSDVPLLIPRSLPADDHWVTSLKIAAGERRTIAFSGDRYERFEKLIWIEPPVYDTPFSEHEPAGVFLHEKLMLDFRRTFHDYSQEASSGLSLPKDVFLARRGNNKRTYNQTECIAVAKKMGFTPVYAEELSLADKIRLFRNAKRIIGPGGSGFSNMIFAGPETRATCWWHKPLKSTDNFDLNLAALGGSQLSIVAESWTTTNNPHVEYRVDLGLLAQGIEDM